MLPFAYLIGEPGSGKTSTANALSLNLADPSAPGGPRLLFDGTAKATYLQNERIMLLGHYDGRLFGGTDTLSWTAAEPMKAFLLTTPAEVGAKWIFGEGDRLANEGFFKWAKEHFPFELIHLRVKPETAQARREARGTVQNPSWLKGRISKVERLARIFPVKTIDGDTATPIEIASQIRVILEKSSQV